MTAHSDPKSNSHLRLPGLKLIRLSVAAKQLGVAQITMRRWIKLGQIPYVTISGRIYFEPGELQALIARHKHWSPPQDPV